MTNPESCPKCGAKNLKPYPVTDKPHYECESWVDSFDRFHESSECKDRQIAQLSDRIAKLERVKDAARELRVHLLHNTFPGLMASEHWKKVMKAVKDTEAPDETP